MTVQEVTRAISAAVDAATGADVAAYESAIARLASHPAAGRLLGDVVRALLEQAHPDGLGADDISAVLADSARSALAWLPPDRVDLHVLLAVVASSLGIHEPGVTYQALDLPPAPERWPDSADTVPVRPPSWADYAWHAPLLIATLVPGRRVGRYLDQALAEIAREETLEAP